MKLIIIKILTFNISLHYLHIKVAVKLVNTCTFFHVRVICDILTPTGHFKYNTLTVM